MNSALLAYQPIYDRNRAIVGGKLLCRSGNGLAMLNIDHTAGNSTRENSELISFYSSIMDLSARLQCPLYLQLSHSFLCSDAFFPLNPADVVIELVETAATPDEEFLDALYRWRQRGYRFVLSDALSNMQLSPQWRAVAEVIAVDINHQSVEQIAEFKEALSGTSAGAVEIADTIQKLYADNVDVTVLYDCMERDSAVALQLFRLANSALYPGHRSLLSAEQALIRIGVEDICKWLILLTCLKHASPGAVHLVLTRACACAEVARLIGNQQITPNDAFLAGFLSGLDLLVNVDKREFLNEMDISSPIREAALSNRGLLGGALSSVIAVEQAVHGNPTARISDKILRVYQQQSVHIHCVLLCI